MSTTVERLTANDLLGLPPDNYRYELRSGVLMQMAPAGFEHGIIVATLTSLLAGLVRTNRLGVICGAETGFLIATNPDTVLAPDVAFVCKARVDAAGKTTKFWTGAPDLAVELMSPGETTRGANLKAREWLAAGSSLVWVVDPRRKAVTVFDQNSEPVTLREMDTLSGSPVVPGFTCAVAEIFA